MKGILFTEILFNKTIRKEKTMTRREPKSLKVINETPDDFHFVGFDSQGRALFDHFDIDTYVINPTYKSGEVVYIKEPYHEDELGIVRYKYDFPQESQVRSRNKFKNKLFVGAKYGRYYIRITSIKVERLYDINEEDCLKEGVDMDYFTDEETGYMMEPMYMDYQSMKMDLDFDAKKSFFSLFRFANRVPKSKEIPNLWVFCYSYCLCDINGNEL